ncbi:hypothetical protein Droror1_Dr00000036 [Drosera rotundifolia]
MGNHNEDEGSFRGHGLNRHDNYSEFRENAVDAERTTHVYYRGQNNNKWFKYEHCWEILRHCAKYSENHGAKRKTVASDEFQLLDRTSHEGVNEDSLTPTIGKRPPGRRSLKDKASGKRQKSVDANSSIDDRIVQSIDELNASSSAIFERSNLLNEHEQKMGVKCRRLQMIRERITMERELATFDKLTYNEDHNAIGSPSDAKKRLAMRQTRIEQQLAEADGNISY